jgi:hypothetical protein
VSAAVSFIAALGVGGRVSFGFVSGSAGGSPGHTFEESSTVNAVMVFIVSDEV